MNKLLFVTCVLLFVFCGYGQQPGPLPSQVAPKAVPRGAIVTPSIEPKSPRSPVGDKPLSPDQPNLTIQAIIIVKTRAEIKEAGVPATKGVEIKDIPILNHPDFIQMVQSRFLGKTL